ncbi:MAG: hypothetical protein KGL39_43220 [Patescibacteria group bacterium]|nr:hypothetical protein [Patescibacteria group bacterium]
MTLAEQFDGFIRATYEGRLQPGSRQWSDLRDAFFAGALSALDGDYSGELVEYLDWRDEEGKCSIT